MAESKQPASPSPTNTRAGKRRSEQAYVLLILFTLVIVGSGLITLILGPSALLTALPCLLAGALTILGLWLMLSALEKWRERM